VRPPTLDEDEGAPEWWRRARRFRAAPLVLAVVVVVIILHAAQGSTPPPLATSCTTPAIALSTASTKEHHPVRWSATGPSSMRFVLTLGVARLDPGAPGRFTPVPDPGLTLKQTQQASLEQTMPKGCKASSTFGVVVPPGSYTVRMFRLTGPRTARVATEVASAHLTVTT
jgi:hypothetical protein